ncbi:MAG TPA: BTAD domain-containing putative transcriptional regulator [Gaiellaceae bacterium]|nr:BTAD domain-containing putative transcriptional regulator [Gaiellaceae bacterium]
MEAIDFRILGPLELRAGGRPLPLGGKKQTALLALFLLHPNEVVSSDRLIDELWPDAPSDAAEGRLHVAVSRLRKQLRDSGETLLVRKGHGYGLMIDPQRVDARRFEHLANTARAALADDGDPRRASELLADALRLWRGPALADFAYEPFAQVEIGRLEELRINAVNTKIDADLALGRHAEAVVELETHVAQHPLDERLRARLMLALYRSGRQAEALAAFEDARRALDELGLEPGEELRTLQLGILRQDPTLKATEAPTALLAEPEPPQLPPSAVPAEDELRPVTVLFADIVGSTRLGERLAPDEAKALIGECVTHMSRAVEEYGGSVQAYQGDGICAYFGVPTAHADDAERGARTGLRIREVVSEYARDIASAWGIADFNVRVGINTGQAAVGLVGAGDPQSVALGDTTNVAARLQALADSGAIVVGEETARRLAHRFVFEPLGELDVKGRTQPVVASTLVRPLTDGRRAPRTLLVGRDAEVERLGTSVEELKAGRGQALLLVGEPGMGKTRMLAELESIAGDDVTWLEGHCLSYGGLTSWPFIEIVRGWLGVELGEPEVVVRTKARAKLGLLLGADLSDVLPALGRLLRIRLDPELEDRLRIEPERLAEEIRRAYVRWLDALAAERPVIVAVEDLHWAHASVRELAESVLELTDRAPVLLVTTLNADPGSEGWRFRLRVLDEYAHRSTQLPLGPLSPEDAAELLAELLPGALDQATRAELVSRAEGNPLYLEEMLRALVDSGGIELRRRTWTISVRSPGLLPPALESLLVARIDRLPPEPRRVAQGAAAIGRAFSVAVLERALPDDDVHGALTVLLRAGIVREVRRYPEFECSFRHGLVQQAALSTLTPSRRRELYGRVAAAYEHAYDGSLDDHLEPLAHYHVQADDFVRALEYVERAAEHAAEVNPGRAVDLWERARQLATRAGDDVAQQRIGSRLEGMRAELK